MAEMTLKEFQSKGGKSRSPKKLKAVRKNAAIARKAKKEGKSK